MLFNATIAQAAKNQSGGKIDLDNFLNGTATAGPSQNVNLGPSLPPPSSPPAPSSGGSIDLNKFLNGTATAGPSTTVNLNNGPSTGSAPSLPSIGLSAIPNSVIFKGIEEIDKTMRGDLTPDTLRAISGTVSMFKKMYDCSPANVQQSPKGQAIGGLITAVDELAKTYSDRAAHPVTANPATWLTRINHNLDVQDRWVGVIANCRHVKDAFK